MNHLLDFLFATVVVRPFSEYAQPVMQRSQTTLSSSLLTYAPPQHAHPQDRDFFLVTRGILASSVRLETKIFKEIA